MSVSGWSDLSNVYLKLVSCDTKIYLLVNSIIPIQVTQSKADIVPMLLDILSWAAHASIHTDVV